MKKILARVHQGALLYFLWGWPLLAAAVCLPNSDALWRSLLDNGALAWILSVPVAALTFLLGRQRRERLMARLCGLREGDERERAVTGEAARFTLLLALSLQAILLVMSLIQVNLAWNPTVKAKNKHGMIWVGLSFDPARHLDPFGSAPEEKLAPVPGNFPTYPTSVRVGGPLISPSAFSILLLLILIEVGVFRAFSWRRYEGIEER